MGDIGFDALGVVLIDCKDDGSAVSVTADPTVLPTTDDFNYDRFIDRLASIYTSALGHNP
ncbi:MAG: hypothetical protein CVU19_14085 [Betaproteobacteria bacterium HGW-Betaproteobacteria-13]|nr:MAG: hypothetical protein CVU19_14085 [Betaproteobacteria bacterium HGW-Betaproteobacteria-13]